MANYIKFEGTPARYAVMLYYDKDTEKVDALFDKTKNEIVDVLEKIEAERPDIVKKVNAKFY